MTDMRALLRQHTPGLYRNLVLARHRQRSLRDRPSQRRAVHIMRRSPEVVVTVDQRVGMGGLLMNAACALEAGRQLDCRVRLRFQSATYQPSWPTNDWLDAYFTRLNTHGEHAVPVISARQLPNSYIPPFERWGPLVWSEIAIDPDIAEHARSVISGDYAAVHFRGSDKYLEAAPVSPHRLLDRVEVEMQSRGLHRLFVASDEPDFIALAVSRFAGRTSVLPVEAVAKNGVPPHFSSVPGEVKAREALATMVILSGARLCVRTESYLSAWAETMASSRTTFMLVAD